MLLIFTQFSTEIWIHEIKFQTESWNKLDRKVHQTLAHFKYIFLNVRFIYHGTSSSKMSIYEAKFPNSACLSSLVKTHRKQQHRRIQFSARSNRWTNHILRILSLIELRLKILSLGSGQISIPRRRSCPWDKNAVSPRWLAPVPFFSLARARARSRSRQHCTHIAYEWQELIFQLCKIWCAETSGIIHGSGHEYAWACISFSFFSFLPLVFFLFFFSSPSFFRESCETTCHRLRSSRSFACNVRRNRRVMDV